MCCLRFCPTESVSFLVRMLQSNSLANRQQLQSHTFVQLKASAPLSTCYSQIGVTIQNEPRSVSANTLITSTCASGEGECSMHAHHCTYCACADWYLETVQNVRVTVLLCSSKFQRHKMEFHEMGADEREVGHVGTSCTNPRH
jgi:hypothetical protein